MGSHRLVDIEAPFSLPIEVSGADQVHSGGLGAWSRQGLRCGAGSGPLFADVPPAEVDSASRAKSPKAPRTFGDLRLIEGQASLCAIRIDAAAKTIAA